MGYVLFAFLFLLWALLLTWEARRAAIQHNVAEGRQPSDGWREKAPTVVVLSLIGVIIIQQLFFNTFHAWVSPDAQSLSFGQKASDPLPYNGQWCEYGAEDGTSTMRLNISNDQLDAAQGDMADNSFEHGGILVTFHAWGFGIYNQTLKVQHVNYGEFGCMDRFARAKNY